MATKVLTKVRPAISEKGGVGFLLWARRDSPVLYSALVKKFPTVARFENLYSSRIQNLGDLSDIFGSIGDAVTGSLSSIGDFITTQAPDLLKAAGTVYAAQQQQQLAQTQLQLAQLQKAPARTAVVPATATQPAYTVAVAQQPAGSGFVQLQRVAQSSVGGFPLWGIAAAGAGAIGLALLLRR